MARTRSISSIDSEIQKIEAELIKVRNKQENLESTLLELQKQKGQSRGSQRATGESSPQQWHRGCRRRTGKHR